MKTEGMLQTDGSIDQREQLTKNVKIAILFIPRICAKLFAFITGFQNVFRKNTVNNSELLISYFILNCAICAAG